MVATPVKLAQDAMCDQIVTPRSRRQPAIVVGPTDTLAASGFDAVFSQQSHASCSENESSAGSVRKVTYDDELALNPAPGEAVGCVPVVQAVRPHKLAQLGGTQPPKLIDEEKPFCVFQPPLFEW
jgi:hypothetical protein